ncbi:MAG: hypothetical protein COU35_02035 [Candidatus Magasanikbacteria bacterium CG10_big_fil_rev_8_21_14_0_10_47_10]|uniref:Amino acid aminotransferase n=1 Tax=Candidatus Magasanikbacteria bacterium CG10_big_fil_rev_8_21_14_0_10_47_10 TaxID=1974652 RepID=A0A2H0TQU9_9BACT|nr:MAG: hypothetical protein COU35_02035 [Candidatus Magasanikbacteria bacterium CG10_big_fil_rev_8_21_14_0_10_47_10]
MLGNFASINGTLVPVSEATVPVDDIAFGYGYGVYETIRLKKGSPLFLRDHIDRLFFSADQLGISPACSKNDIATWINTLIKNQAIETANIKMILIGNDPTPTLYIFLLAPKFVEKKEYRDGIMTISVEYERFLPQAKSLNMLGSTLAYRAAKQADCYDALLVDRQGNITEGTRSNFFAMRGTDLYTPPAVTVLAGITRTHVIACAKENGRQVYEQTIPLADALSYDTLFLTNTSSGIVPIKQVDNKAFASISDELRAFTREFAAYTDANA